MLSGRLHADDDKLQTFTFFVWISSLRYTLKISITVSCGKYVFAFMFFKETFNFPE